MRIFLSVSVAIAAVALAACGPTSALKNAANNASGKNSSGSNQVSDLQASIKAGKTATFSATYTQTGTSTDTIVIEQKPPKSAWKTGTDSVWLDDGTKSDICSQSDGAWTCIESTDTNGEGAGNSLAALYSGDTVITEMDAFKEEALWKILGVDVKFTTETFAGQSSTCMKVSYTGKPDFSKWCVTKAGILAAIDSNTSTFELTSFTTNVSDSDFAVPTGANIVTSGG